MEEEEEEEEDTFTPQSMNLLLCRRCRRREDRQLLRIVVVELRARIALRESLLRFRLSSIHEPPFELTPPSLLPRPPALLLSWNVHHLPTRRRREMVELEQL
jgi:hypothetical protein